MAILNQKRILNLIPKVSAPVTIHVSQGDVGTQIEFTLVKGDEVFVNPGNVTASVHGVREDGANFGPFTCTLNSSKVTFPLHSEMTAVKGSAIAEIVLVDNGGNKVGSANFGIMVEESVFPLGVTYDNDVSVYESILAYAQTIPAQVEADIAQEASARRAADAAFNTALATTNSNLSGEISARTSADALINTRIDEIIAPSGEAPSAAEVQDARIGADGTTYATLGDAIREPIALIDETVLPIINTEQGTINANGEETAATNRTRTTYLLAYGTFAVKQSNFGILSASYYTKDTHEFIRRDNVSASSVTLNNMNMLVRLVLTRNSGTDFTPNEVDLFVNTGSINAALLESRNDDTLYTIPMEQGSINALGEYTDNSKRIRSTIFIDGTVTLNLIAEQYTRIYAINVFEKDGTYRNDLSLVPLTQQVTLTLDGYMVKVVCAKRTSSDSSYNQPITPSNVTLLCTSNKNVMDANGNFMNGMYDIHKQINAVNNVLEYTGTEKFNIDTNLREYDSIDIDFSDTANFMSNIYNLFDSLATDNPGYITRFDLPEEYHIEYPTYANNYKMYGYLLYNSIANIGAYDGGSHPMPTIILTGGLHGNEYAAPYNLYLFAKELCEDYLKDDNLFKIRSAFKILIIPCVNGYGLNHATRNNYNDVDINRNFDCDNWTADSSQHTGDSPNDQFETQVIVAAINAFKPKGVIDCHNYSRGETRQFFASICNPRLINMAYRAITEIAYAIKKKYPQYFGTDFGTITEVAGAAPYQISPTTMGTLSVYAYLNGVKVSSTLEINNCINYNNGVSTASTEIDLNGTDTFAVGEYTLRNQLLRYMQYILDTINN